MRTNVTAEQIREQLQKVFTNAAMTAQYNSDNEQYDGICGWCGVMAPISRPAFVHDFGEAATAQAEREARADIETWQKEYAVSEWAAHKAEADKHEAAGQPVPEVGFFCWANTSNWKCDGGKGFIDEIENQWYAEHDDDINVSRVLVKVAKVVTVSVDELDRAALADELAAAEKLPGGGWIEKDEHLNMVAPFALHYTEVTAITDGVRYYFIDSEGYDYARYILFPNDWRKYFALQVIAINDKHEEEQLAKKQQEQKEHAIAMTNYTARCKRWSTIMRPVTDLEKQIKAAKYGTPEYTVLKRKLTAVRRANILAMCRKAFPGVKFSLTKNDGWGSSWTLTYTDGPTEEAFNEAVDLDLFVTHYDTFDGMTDCSDVINVSSKFSTFARTYMGNDGSTKGVKVEREMSDETEKELCAKVVAAVPELKGNNGGKGFHRDFLSAGVRIKIADLVGNDWARTWIYVSSLAREIFDKTDYYKAPEPTKTVAGSASKAASTEADSNKILTFEAYSEKAIVVRGYNDAQYTDLVNMGGKYNRRLKGGAGIIFSAKKHAEIIAEYIAANHTA